MGTYKFAHQWLFGFLKNRSNFSRANLFPSYSSFEVYPYLTNKVLLSKWSLRLLIFIKPAPFYYLISLNWWWWWLYTKTYIINIAMISLFEHSMYVSLCFYIFSRCIPYLPFSNITILYVLSNEVWQRCLCLMQSQWCTQRDCSAHLKCTQLLYEESKHFTFGMWRLFVGAYRNNKNLQKAWNSCELYFHFFLCS